MSDNILLNVFCNFDPQFIVAKKKKKIRLLNERAFKTKTSFKHYLLETHENVEHLKKKLVFRYFFEFFGLKCFFVFLFAPPIYLPGAHALFPFQFWILNLFDI